jgi:hypothetical protein
LVVAAGVAAVVEGAEAVVVTAIAEIVAAVVVAGNRARIGVEWILMGRGSASRFPRFFSVDGSTARGLHKRTRYLSV